MTRYWVGVIVQQHNVIFYHTYLTIRTWLQKGISPSAWWLNYDIKMAKYELSHGSGTYGPCKRWYVSWGKHCSSFIQQQEDTGPTNWGPKLVHTMAWSFSIIILSLQYSSLCTPWMQLQNLKESLSINKSLLFITYFLALYTLIWTTVLMSGVIRAKVISNHW